MSSANPALCVFVIIAIAWSIPKGVICQDDSELSDSSPAGVNLFTGLIFNRFSNYTGVFRDEVKKHLKFCIKNVDADWDSAFNFSSDTTFLSNCIRKTKEIQKQIYVLSNDDCCPSLGDIMQRLCTAAEIKLYFNSFYSGESRSTNYLQLNANCNLTSWVSGCEPGWACSVGPNKKVDLKNAQVLPDRTIDCNTCCEGFFCPHGLTCMIPCPLGSYCPLAKLNKATGICEPYNYQLPPGQLNKSCGGADIWADIGSGSEIFCSAGSYCPSTIQKIPCSSGYYCRIGSTAQKRCFRMTTCDKKSANQNITAYGVLLFVGLCIILICVYNCSDQVLTTRERKQATKREEAARSARETAQAREKWKSAKDVARKHAFGLQAQFSRTFSRVKSTRQPDKTKSSGPLPGTDAALSSMQLDTSSTSTASKGKKKGKSNLAKMVHALEEDPESHEGFNLEIGDKNLKKMPKAKQLHTHSQIFKYAYGQIEKEKALQEQQMNMSFSGVVSMANDIEIRPRPMIEVAFEGLTLTLKGKNKHLMRCVSGKIMPGRVSAVMGPSGAGKTTFLSALAGKPTGCTMTGSILINGKDESMRSYKKIIGFVPQDDIVHGNLTVEENLWFSARCRLSAGLPKQEKVLVVERVIESLGLQPVRDSLVGTVEKRGISGGQRKRVNVGLEMVMEPSLLILDEPTSGLDSSSSQLLLRALRREALEGVNVCMVVHQPSYSLFRMFDDLILLAKGGLTVYHGSVKKVEEYFSELGITVPDRVNPPDHYIDILEGIIKPNSSTAVDQKQLPVRWMLHNGYPVPLDMQQEAGVTAFTASGSSDAAQSEKQSFLDELWQDVVSNIALKKDYVQNHFFQSKDLSNRVTAGVLQQYKYFLGRVGKQRLREARIQAVDYLILLLAGICLGTLAKVSDATFGALGYNYTVIAVSLLCKIGALRSFSLDKLHYWRERASGMSSLAYFLAKDTVDHLNTIIKPLVYLSMFYFFNNPRSSFPDNYFILLCLVYCVTGIAYLFAIAFEPGPAQLWSVLLPVVLTLVATQQNQSGFLKKVADLCYTKWALEAFVIANTKRYSGVWLITRCGSLMKSGYDLNNWVYCLSSLIVAGIISRTIAFFFMVILHKK